MGDTAFPSVKPVSDQNAFQILRPHRRQVVSGGVRRGNNKSLFPSTAHATNDNDDSADEQDRGRATTGSKKKGKKTHEKRKVRPGSYEALGLNMELCSALQAAGYNFPTPIQRKVIPAVLSGDDVVAMARTGSGKTAAFLAPLLHRLYEGRQAMSVMSRQNGPRALILAPTRELVLQEVKFCNLYSKRMEKGRVRIAVVVGGTPLEAQFEALAICPDILFATPGRLLQIMAEMNGGHKSALSLSTTEMLVLDEADRLFEGTLAYETSSILDKMRDKTTETLSNGVHGERQTILVSATMPHALKQFSATGLRKCLSVIRLDADKSMSPTIATAFLNVRADFEKEAALCIICRRVLESAHNSNRSTAVVFAATHRRVEYLTDLLRDLILPPRAKNREDLIGCIHGSLDQLARQETVAKFRKRKMKILIVTDVAARGIDLPDLDVVVNYDMPATPKLFIHRVGRVGRAGRFGCAFNLVGGDELPYVLDVMLYLGREMKFAKPMKKSANEDDLGYEHSFQSDPYCMDTSFTFGMVPKNIVEEQIETIRAAVEDIELSKALKSAKNAQTLYVKTRGTPGGESVRRAKALLFKEDGGRIPIYVHPWFVDMLGSNEVSIQKDTTEHIARLSTWRPKECVVTAPKRIIERKDMLKTEAESDKDALEIQVDGVDRENDGDVEMTLSESNKQPTSEIDAEKRNGGDIVKNSKQTRNIKRKKSKISLRQAALEEERKEFFLPAQLDVNRRREHEALKVKLTTSNKGSGNSHSGSGLDMYRELDDAVMDVNGDANEDLLRMKHNHNGGQQRYWDRVAKKFVKGDATDTTSKRNLHVASREAKMKARANNGQSYATEDGVLYRKWLSKNRKAIQNMAAEMEENPDQPVAQHLQIGLGNNDFRKGAFGRKGRVAMAARSVALGTATDSGKPGNGQRNAPELKPKEVIMKERKLKTRAQAKRNKKKKSKSSHYQAPQRGASKSRVIVRNKK